MLHSSQQLRRHRSTSSTKPDLLEVLHSMECLVCSTRPEMRARETSQLDRLLLGGLEEPTVATPVRSRTSEMHYSACYQTFTSYHHILAVLGLAATTADCFKFKLSKY